jgi:hypothetical protein
MKEDTKQSDGYYADDMDIDSDLDLSFLEEEDADEV